MQNENYSGSNHYLGDFNILSSTCQRKPLPGYEKKSLINSGDIVMLIEALELEHPGRVDKENSKMIIGTDDSERVIPLDLSTKHNFLIGYSLIIDKNLEVNIRDSSEVIGYNKQSEPPFIIPGIKGTFMFYPSDPKKERPSLSLLGSVEQAVRNYYSEKFE